MVSSYRSLEGYIDDNIDWAVSGTKHGRIQGPEGEVMVSHWEQHWKLKLELRCIPLMCSQ